MGIIRPRDPTTANNGQHASHVLVRYDSVDYRLLSSYRAFDSEKGEKQKERKGERQRERMQYYKHVIAATRRKMWANTCNRLFIGKIIQT